MSNDDIDEAEILRRLKERPIRLYTEKEVLGDALDHYVKIDDDGWE